MRARLAAVEPAVPSASAPARGTGGPGPRSRCAAGVVAARRARQHRQQGGLAGGQRRRRLVEVAPGGRLDAVGAVAVVDAVQVLLQDAPACRQRPLQAAGRRPSRPACPAPSRGCGSTRRTSCMVMVDAARHAPGRGARSARPPAPPPRASTPPCSKKRWSSPASVACEHQRARSRSSGTQVARPPPASGERAQRRRRAGRSPPATARAGRQLLHRVGRASSAEASAAEPRPRASASARRRRQPHRSTTRVAAVGAAVELGPVHRLDGGGGRRRRSRPRWPGPGTRCSEAPRGQHVGEQQGAVVAQLLVLPGGLPARLPPERAPAGRPLRAPSG